MNEDVYLKESDDDIDWDDWRVEQELFEQQTVNEFERMIQENENYN